MHKKNLDILNKLDKQIKITIGILIFIMTTYAIFSTPLYGKDKCLQYEPYLKYYSQQVFKKDFPYWFLVGQDKQESGCRFIISYDGVGSESPAQITWRVWRRYLKPYGIYNLRTNSNFTKAQVLIMKNCKKQAYSSHLWVSVQIYNGGSLVNKEIERARKVLGIREVSHNQARRFCRRRIIHFRNGQSISACSINYNYSEKVFKYGKEYKEKGFNTSYKFW